MNVSGLPLPRIARVAWTAALMAAFALALVSLARRLPAESGGEELVLFASALLAGVALGGALGARLAGAAWPDLLLGSALSAVFLVLVFLFFFPEFSPPRPGDYPGALRDLILALLIQFVVAAAGVFMLPLVDPRVRAEGPALSRLVLVPLAFGLVLVLALADRLFLGGSFPGLITLVVGGLAALILAALGLLLALFRVAPAGAFTGGLAILVWILTVFAWYLSGKPWFP